jgi:tRNA A-37 threonylcarbamoyl transferase component Bud32
MRDWQHRIQLFFLVKKRRKKPFRGRSLDMQINTKRLRLVFYLLATVELVLVSVAWGRLPLH